VALDTIERWTRWIAAAAGIATLAAALWRGVWRGLQRPPGRTTGAADRVLRAPIQLVFGALWIGVCALLWRPIPLVLSASVRAIALILGVSLAFPGLALYWWGAGTLGEMYKPASALGVQLNVQHRLPKAHGPFALVRHPLYLGLQMAAFGGLLIFRTWTLVFVAVNFLVLVLRARRVPGWIPRLRRHRFRR
jgi:protein-S-isoprenylcysteine O-methyltransferase Ste14